MTEVRDAMIVAGGKGTRLRPLTLGTPKPLVPFCGRPFLAGVMERLAAAGVRTVHLIVGSDTSPFERLRPDAERLGLTLRMVPEPEPLDTAGGVRAAVDDVEDAFLVLNGDILTDVDLEALVAHHRASGAEATLTLNRVEDTSSYGVCVRDGSRIVEFVEKPAPGTLPGQDTINAGTYVLEPSVLERFPIGRLSFERQVFPGALEAGDHLEGFVWEGVWADLGTPERFRTGHRLALSGALRWPSVTEVPERAPTVRVADSAAVAADATLVPPVLVLDDAEIAGGTTVGPYAVVGRGARVAAGATLVDSVLFDRASVGDDVVACSLLAGEGASIAGGAELGAGVVLGDDAEVTAGQVLLDGERRPDPQV